MYAIICPAVVGLVIVLLGTFAGVAIAKIAKRPTRQGGWIGALVGAILGIAFTVWSISICGFCQ
jgi:hypothetical protein